jgi:hypothetical protein
MSVDLRKCQECQKLEADCDLRIDHNNGMKYCADCMKKLDLVWDNDIYEIIPRYTTCHDCGGEMVWCDICEVYNQNCCVDYGTCGCS